MKLSTHLITSKLSIKSQAIAIVITGIILMMVILSLVTTQAVNQQSRQLMLKNAFQITQGLAKQSVFPILSGSNQNAQSAMEQVIGFQSVMAARLLLEDEQSEFIRGGHAEFPNANVHRKTEQAEVIAESPAYWLVTAPVILESDVSDDDEFELGVSSYTQGEKLLGYAQVLYSKQNLVQAQTRINFTISLIGIISVCTLSLLLYIALVKLFRPLDNLAQTMALAQETTEHTYAEEVGAKELREMAYSYNNMMRVLEQHEDKLTLHRDVLEKEVQIRTRELVQARDSALTASRHKSEFMANMSHELRTPIQSILGYGELINESLMLEDNFELLDDMDKITKNAERLLIMINNLLDLAKIEAGKHDINLVEINMEKVVSDLYDVIPPLASKNNNQFQIESSVDDFIFVTDKDKLEQTLINLLGNACKFTENGQVSLAIRKTSQHLKFSVKDTGIGLSQAQQKFIFEEFRQVDSGQNRKFSGTGLGLAISQKFVELLGGRIEIKSELGQGAVFTVILPINKSLN